MSYFVSLTFNLKNASSEKYKLIGDTLKELGLSNHIKGSSGELINLPANVYAGEFEGENASKVRQDICDLIVENFKKVKVKTSFFVTVGGNWAWGARLT
jgi:hypothetical protein